jgi:HlyD family secretion protein
LPSTEPPTIRGGSAAPTLSDKVRSLRIEPPPRKTGGSAGVAWLLCLVFAAAAAFFGYKAYGPRLEAAGEASAAPTGTQANSTPAQSASPAPAHGSIVLESKGYIVPAHQILVSPKVSGMVRTLRIVKPGESLAAGRPLEEGERVQKGDILAILETTDYEADVARTKALLSAAEQRLAMEHKNLPNEIERALAELNEAKTNRDYLKTVLDRSEKLAKTNAISPNELEQRRSDFEAGSHRVERLQNAVELVRGPQVERLKLAEAEVSQARAELTKAEWRLDNCTILAPVSGTILKKNVEEGNIVNPIAFNGSFSICDMADLSQLEVDLSIQERDVSKVYKGQRCVIRCEAYPDRPYHGTVSRLMPIADRAKGAVPVRVKIRVPAEEEGIYLKPEMGAVVSFYAAGEAENP